MNKQMIILLSLAMLAYVPACKTQKQVKQVEPKPELIFDTPTSPEYEALRLKFMKSDSICNCDMPFSPPTKYRYISTIKGAIAISDSLRKAEYYGIFRFYEDDSIAISLHNNFTTSTTLYIYHKKLYTTQIIDYSYAKGNIETSNFKERTKMGYAYDTLGNPTIVYNNNYIERFSVHTSKHRDWISEADSIREVEAGEAIKKKYPICWREAFELVKLFGGDVLTDDTRFSRSGSLFYRNLYWGFESKERNVSVPNDYVDYFSVNPVDGKIFHERRKTKMNPSALDDE
jgi:hypothetical protein